MAKWRRESKKANKQKGGREVMTCSNYEDCENPRERGNERWGEDTANMVNNRSERKRQIFKVASQWLHSWRRTFLRWSKNSLCTIISQYPRPLLLLQPWHLLAECSQYYGITQTLHGTLTSWLQHLFQAKRLWRCGINQEPLNRLKIWPTEPII